MEAEKELGLEEAPLLGCVVFWFFKARIVERAQLLCLLQNPQGSAVNFCQRISSWAPSANALGGNLCPFK